MSAYCDTPTETLRTWLAQALASRQQQMIGPSSVGGDGRSMRFERSKAELDAYISDLRNEISRREGSSTSGPIQIAF